MPRVEQPSGQVWDSARTVVHRWAERRSFPPRQRRLLRAGRQCRPAFRTHVFRALRPFLIQQGFLRKTPKGRLLGKRAYDCLGCKPGEAGPDGGQEMLF